MRVRYCVVIQKDGLDLEGTIEILSKYGTVCEYHDYKDGDDFDVVVFYMEGSFANLMGIKLGLNCVSAEDNEYVLFPMLNLEEKMKVLRARA